MICPDCKYDGDLFYIIFEPDNDDAGTYYHCINCDKIFKWISRVPEYFETNKAEHLATIIEFNTSRTATISDEDRFYNSDLNRSERGTE
jgi:hypothetical protein